jgi:hypothetical protein
LICITSIDRRKRTQTFNIFIPKPLSSLYSDSKKSTLHGIEFLSQFSVTVQSVSSSYRLCGVFSASKAIWQVNSQIVFSTFLTSQYRRQNVSCSFVSVKLHILMVQELYMRSVEYNIGKVLLRISAVLF